MTDVEKSEILHIWHVCDVENVAIHAKIIAIYAVLLLNLLFTLLYREISCGEKLSPKVHLWRKMTNMRSDFVMVILRMLCSFKVEIAIYLQFCFSEHAIRWDNWPCYDDIENDLKFKVIIKYMFKIFKDEIRWKY